MQNRIFCDISGRLLKPAQSVLRGGPGVCGGHVRPLGARWYHGAAWGRARRQSGSCDPRAPQPQPAHTHTLLPYALPLAHPQAHARRATSPAARPSWKPRAHCPDPRTPGWKSPRLPRAVYRGLERHTSRASPIRRMIAALPDSRHMDTKRFMHVYTICICMHTSTCLLLSMPNSALHCM